MSLFKKPNKNVKRKNRNRVIDNPIVVKNYIGKDEDADLFFVLEKPYSIAEKNSLIAFMSKTFPNIKYVAISSVILKVIKSDIEKDVLNFYKQNRVNLLDYIPKGKKIISVGRAIYSITGTDDLTTGRTGKDDDLKSIISGFYDTLLWRTYFYDPDLKAKVYPVDESYRWLGKDNFESWFLKKQIEKAYNDNYVPSRTRPLKLAYVENPNKWLMERVNDKIELAWDIETKGLDPWSPEGKIICITMSFDGKEGFYLDWNKIDTNILELFMRGKKGIGTNCLEGKTKVLMEDGRELPISYIVKNKVTDRVMCYDNDGNLTSRPITHHFYNGKLDRNKERWVKIGLKTKKNKGNYPNVLCTEDHEIYTVRGKIKAKDLVLEDKVLYKEGFNKDFKQFLYGSFLGDGAFIQTGDCHYISFEHAENQVNYLEWKKNLIERNGFRTSNIKEVLTKEENHQNRYSFRMKANNALRYFSKNLTIDASLANLDLLGLLIWYLDDGHLYKNKYISISCFRFTKEQASIAVNRINSILGFEACKNTPKGNKKCFNGIISYYEGGQIVFNKEGSDSILNKINEILPRKLCEYKFGSKDLDVSIKYEWDVKKTFVAIDIAYLDRISPSPKKRAGVEKFDIEVEEFHNYIANGIKVSNCKYDIKWLVVKGGINKESLEIYSDTMQLSHVINEMRRMGLKSGVWTHTENLGGYDKPLDEYIEKYPACKKDYSLIPFDVMFPYATTDPCASYILHKEFLKELDELHEHLTKVKKEDSYANKVLSDEWTPRKYYFDIVMKAVNKFCKAELKGLGVNLPKLAEMAIQLRKEITELELELHTMFGTSKESFNLYSGKQLGEKIQELGWKVEEVGKKNEPLTKDSCLQRWKKQGHKEAELLLKLREKNALMKTFVGEPTGGKNGKPSGFYQYLTYDREFEKNNLAIIYPKIWVMLANSDRSRHSDPNTANIPSHGQKAFFVRQQFAPKSKTSVFVSADQAGLQLRIATMLSEDPVMMDIFKNQSGDMHSVSAMSFFYRTRYVYEDNNGVLQLIPKGEEAKFSNKRRIELKDFLDFKKRKIEEVLSSRFKVKSANFGFLFGLSFISFAERNLKPEWSIEECENYITENGLSDSYTSLYDRFYDDKLSVEDNVDSVKYLTVAKHLREMFFDLYSVLANWLEVVKDFGRKHTFAISPYWRIRRLPQLSYEGIDSNRKQISGLLNISINSPVQTIESVIMNRSLIKTDDYLEDNNLRSHFFGQVHDAVELEVEKNELSLVCTKLKIESEMEYPEYKGVPLEMEGTVNDYYGTYEQFHIDDKTGKRVEDWDLWDVGGEDWDKYTRY